MFKINRREMNWLLSIRKVLALRDPEGDIALIRKLCESAKLSIEGRVYLHALEKAFNEHGKKGLMHQVNYILANGRWRSKDDRKSLMRYAKTGNF